MYIFVSIFLILALLGVLVNHRRRKCIIKKVCVMTQKEKCELLNEKIRPFGYQYIPCQDIFCSTLDAWQREFGYTHSYDCFAPYLNMVFDSEPVFFDYNNRTWLIEFWKGQYGINTGAEIGIYCADKIIPANKRKRELFHVVADEDMPVFSIHLIRNTDGEERTLSYISMTHWWLTAFRMGCFSKPENLRMNCCITFPNCGMMHAFANALIRLGYDARSLYICGLRICFSFRTPNTPVPCGFVTRPVRCLAQWKNRCFCHLFLRITKPFCSTADRLLYLYFYLPFIFRHCLRLRRCKNCSRGRRKTKCRGLRLEHKRNRGDRL